MTEEGILDLAADFVRSRETNLKLALLVDRAMPNVREHLIRTALEAVEECFSRTVRIID